MKLTFLRHGKTDFNCDVTLSGWTDAAMNAEGIAEVTGLLASLPKNTFDCVCTSPLKRASATAEMIAKHLGLPISPNPDLRERHFGSLEGKSWEEARAAIGQDAFDIDRRQEYDYTPFGGESAAMVRERVQRFVQMMRTSGCTAPLIVTHSGIIRLLFSLYEGKTLGHVEHQKLYELTI